MNGCLFKIYAYAIVARHMLLYSDQFNGTGKWSNRPLLMDECTQFNFPLKLPLPFSFARQLKNFQAH